MNPSSQRLTAISMRRTASRESSGHRTAKIPWLALTRFATAVVAVVLILFVGARLFAWVSTALGVTLFSAITSAQAASVLTANVPAGPLDPAIVTLAENYRKAVLARDVPAALSMFREDAIEMPPFQPPVAGRTAIENFYRQSLTGPGKVTAFSFTHREAIAQGDLAYDVGSYSRTIAGGTSSPIEAKGVYVVILKRTGPDWKIAYLTYTCDCPPPANR